MKFTIEIEDFYLDEEELSEALSSHIKREVVNQISESIKGKVEAAITAKVSEAMNEKLVSVIDSALTDCIATGTIIVNREPVAITAHLKNIFQSNTGWNNPADKMTTLAKKFGEDLKIQYNNIFATKIVMTMHQQGFLKDDMAKVLLGEAKG